MRPGIVFLLCVCGVSCKNEPEVNDLKNIAPENIYYDYKVSAEEGKQDVTVMLQYRYLGENGPSFKLEEPGNVQFDGELLIADSAEFTGIFYETIKPVSAFSGKHTIVFIDGNKREHKEEFSFRPFTLANEFPAQVKKDPFLVKLKDFPEEPTSIRLVMTDTAFLTRDVNEEMVVEKGELAIDLRHLNALSAGPVNFEIFMEDEKRLKTASKRGGRLLITYGIRRQFELAD